MSEKHDRSGRRAAIMMGIGLLGTSIGLEMQASADEGYRLATAPCASIYCKRATVSRPPTGVTPTPSTRPRQDPGNRAQPNPRERSGTTLPAR